MRFALIFAWSFFSVLALAQGETESQLPNRYSQAAESIEVDLRAELDRLAKVRERIAAERPALARKTNQIAADLREKQRKAHIADQRTQALQYELNKSQSELGLWREERAYILSLLEDYRKQFESQIGLAEVKKFGGKLQAAEASDVESQLDVMELAFARLEKARGGQTLQGKVIDSNGVARDGTFIQVGPVTWFVSPEEKLAGLVRERTDLQPEIAANSGSPKTLASLAAGNTARPRFDPTLGTALALGEADQSVIDHIRDGGVWIYPILLLALVAIAAAVYKWIQIMGIRDLRPGLVRRVLAALEDGDRQKARVELQDVRHPARDLLERGVEMAHHSRTAVEEAMYEKFIEAQPRLQRGLPFIAIVAATAPLLGLLGTVTGMIHTFKLINIFGTGDARSLASGISEALVTTEFGLIVAIPALILHALLSRKVKGILGTMEMASLAFVNGRNANDDRH